MTTPENRLLRPLLILLIAAGAVFGLGPFLVPTQFADLVGYEGQDVFLFRLAGAATFGYSAGLAAGLNSRWPALRIPFAATATFNSASIVACLIAIVRGDATLVTYLILVSSLLFTTGTVYFLRNPPAGEAAGASGLAGWLVALIAVSTVLTAVLGLAGLFGGGGAARLVGYGGADDFVYRQSGAAALGYSLAGVLMLRSRRWAEWRLPMIMGLAFNGLGLLAAIFELAGGGEPIAWLILAVTVVVTPLSALALRRQGT